MFTPVIFSIKGCPSCATALAGSGLGQVVPVLDGQAGQRFQRLQAGIVAQGLVGVFATGLEPSGAASDGYQAFCQPAQVEPVVAAGAARFEGDGRS